MSEHRIRLRGGWEARALDGLPAVVERLTLPVRWEFDRPRRLRLSRRFRRPPRAEPSQLVLLLEQVPGISWLELNGETPVGVSPEQTRYEVPLDRLAERNQLVLEVETPRWSDRAGGEAPEWGWIALVIRTGGPVEAG